MESYLPNMLETELIVGGKNTNILVTIISPLKKYSMVFIQRYMNEKKLFLVVSQKNASRVVKKVM